MARNILILGASYGSLLGTKLLMAGHNVTLVCRNKTAELINRDGTEVRIKLRDEAAKAGKILSVNQNMRYDQSMRVLKQIIESGAQELQALEAYIRAGASDVEKVTTEADDRIKQYEDEIAKLKIVMQQRVEEQNKVMASCNTKKLDVQKVVRESPKLHEPSH